MYLLVAGSFTLLEKLAVELVFVVITRLAVMPGLGLVIFKNVLPVGRVNVK